MAGFLVRYRAPRSGRAQVESSTRELQQAGMELWQPWAAKARSAIVDLGAPLGDGEAVGNGEAYNDIAGFSILEADSQQDVVDLLTDHHHFQTPDGQIDEHQQQVMPTP